jgi:hypothetical protein
MKKLAVLMSGLLFSSLVWATDYMPIYIWNNTSQDVVVEAQNCPNFGSPTPCNTSFNFSIAKGQETTVDPLDAGTLIQANVMQVKDTSGNILAQYVRGICDGLRRKQTSTTLILMNGPTNNVLCYITF